LMLLAVAVLSSLLLGEELHLGSTLGAAPIVVGLYAVLWGKGHEMATDVAKIHYYKRMGHFLCLISVG
ncbi:hypothetical protein BAE44_0013682, partial [Dichanthelium oligosanthes]